MIAAVAHDEHFLSVARYVEWNPLRAGLMARAEDWRWSSPWARTRGAPERRVLLSRWPVEEPERAAWIRLVHEAQTEVELAALRLSVQRGRPHRGSAWARRLAAEMHRESTLRPRGRPRKGNAGACRPIMGLIPFPALY